VRVPGLSSPEPFAGGGAGGLPVVTVGERVLVHLSGFLRHADAYECPPEMTQDGIAAALGISRAHVALELKRLRSLSRVEERMAHVAGAKTRRKVYHLTPAGQEIARRMREHARGRTVTLGGPDGMREVKGEEAIAALRQEGVRESEAIHRVLVLDRIELAPPLPKAPPPPSRPFFGREAESRAIREWLASGRSGIAVVIGVAGIGKSALLAHVLASADRPRFLRKLYAHDDAHGILSSCADFLARQARRRLKSVLTRPAYDPTEALAVLRDDFAGCLLAFDDLQACPAAEGLLRSLMEKTPDWKLLVASRVQPAFYDRSAVVDGAVVEIPLAGLEPTAAEALLQSRGTRLPAAGLRRVMRSTQGHPLALELFAGSGLDAGEAETERFILETVLDGLDDVSEELMEGFAVLRRPARSPEALGATVAQLRRLLRKAILQHREEGYLLHDFVKEFFLRRMRDSVRWRAHARAATYWGDRGDPLEESYHRIEAQEFERAAGLLRTYGDAYAESARAGDLEACLLRLPPRLRPVNLLAETQMFLGKFPDARTTLRGIVRMGAPEEQVRARIHLGRIENRLGEYTEARTTLLRAAKDAEALGRADLEGEAFRALGGVERKLGDLAAAIEHLSGAAEALEANPRERARALTDLGAALIAKGDLAAARDRLEAAHLLCRRGSREDAVVANNMAIVLSREGNQEAAAKAFERSAEIALGTGEVRFASYALANAVDNLLQLGSLEAAAARAEQAVSLASTIEDPLALSTARANLGLVHARRGDWPEAERHLLESVDLIARLDNPYSLASRYAEIARVYDAQGRAVDAAPWRARAEDLFARLKASGEAKREP
jgi:tetratricopeptide (TPR) repeat protein/DNA-binding MarR family transcriptional regulator